MNLDFLATRARDLPPRHRSARAVFNYTWELLNAREQIRFSKLSVFRGDFTLQAAISVAQIRPATLNILVEKSILRSDKPGRYQVHELLRQYGEERLQQNPAEYALVQTAHGRTYGKLMQEQAARLRGPEQKVAIEAIRADLDNVQAAWQWAITHQDTAVLQQSAAALFKFFVWHGRYQEGIDLFRAALDPLQNVTTLETQETRANLNLYLAALLARLSRHDEAQRLLAEALALAKAHNLAAEMALVYLYQGQAAYTLAQYDEAKSAYQESLNLYQALADTGGEAEAIYGLGNTHYQTNHFEQAQTYFEAALAMERALNDQYGIARALNGLAAVAHSWSGDYVQANALYQESLALRRDLDDVLGTAVTLNMLANLASVEGELLLARQYYEESLAIRREIGAPLGLAVVTGNLGTIYYELGEYDTAVTLYTESLTISRRIGDDLGVAYCLANLAEAAHAKGDFAQAEKQWRDALQMGLQLENDDRILFALYGLAALWLDPETAVYNQQQGLRLLHYVAHHPACSQEVKAQAALLLPDILTLSVAEPETRELTAVADEIVIGKP